MHSVQLEAHIGLSTDQSLIMWCVSRFVCTRKIGFTLKCIQTEKKQKKILFREIVKTCLWSIEHDRYSTKKTAATYFVSAETVWQYNIISYIKTQRHNSSCSSRVDSFPSEHRVSLAPTMQPPHSGFSLSGEPFSQVIFSFFKTVFATALLSLFSLKARCHKK